MNRPNVLIVGPDLDLHGGIVSVVQNYLDYGLADRCASLEYMGTGVGYGPVGKLLAFLPILVRFRFGLNKFDIVHLHISAKGSYMRKSLMARIAHNAGKRVILHEHDGEFAKTFEAESEAYREDVRKTFSIADKVVVLSEEWADYFAENVCDPEKIVVLHNAVAVPEKACTPGASQTILFLGRLCERKSPDVLLRASTKALEMFPDARLVFGGDGDVELNTALANQLGIRERCDFVGWVSGANREKLFQEAGLLCLPSKNEGMPMCLLEAMGHGIPVVSTSVGGVPRLIDDGVTGYLMPVDDERELEEILVKLLGSAELRASVGLAGRNKIQADFSLDSSLDKLANIYRELS